MEHIIIESVELKDERFDLAKRYKFSISSTKQLIDDHRRKYFPAKLWNLCK